MSHAKVLHVVTAEQGEFAFARVQDALLLIKVLSRARIRATARPPAVSVRLRPAIGYVDPPQIRYETTQGAPA